MVLAELNFDSAEVKGYIAIAMGILGLAYLTLRQSAKKRRDPLEQQPTISLAQQRSVERQMNNLIVEMADMARQITAQLDTRAARLEELIRQADQRIGQLNRGDSLSPGAPAPPSDSRNLASADSRSEPPEPSKHADIYALADQGKSPADIARALDRPRGEVELILALRPRPADQSTPALEATTH